MSCRFSVLPALLLAALWLTAPASQAQPADLPGYSEVLRAFERGDYATAFRGASQRSEWNDERVDYLLGRMYYEGLGTRPDRQRAHAYFQAAADRDDRRAWHALGEMYRLGEVVNRNPGRACDLYEQSARAGWPPAEYAYGRCLIEGRGRPADPADGAQWLHRAAASDHAEALKRLLDLYRAGRPFPERRPPLLAQAQAALEADDPGAAEALARRALGQGAVGAHGVLGAVLVSRPGAESREAGEAHLRVAEAAGDAFGRFHLAQFQREREGADILTRPFCDAMDSAAAGYPPAAAWLGECYRRGEGRPPDPGRAAAEFRRAADSGSLQAYLGLARLYVRGEGVEQDWVAAVRWAARARRAGSEDAGLAEVLEALPTVTARSSLTKLASAPGTSPEHPVDIRAGDRLRLVSLATDWAEIYEARGHRTGWLPRSVLQEAPATAFGSRLGVLTRAEVRERMAGRPAYAPRAFGAGEDLYLTRDDDFADRLWFIYGPDGRLRQFRVETTGVTDPAIFQRRARELDILHGPGERLPAAHFGQEQIRWQAGNTALGLTLDRVAARTIEQYALDD